MVSFQRLVPTSLVAALLLSSVGCGSGGPAPAPSNPGFPDQEALQREAMKTLPSNKEAQKPAPVTN